MSLSLDELQRVVNEIRDMVRDSVLQKIRQIDTHVLILEFFGRQGAVKLLICTKIGFVRIHPVDKAPAGDPSTGPRAFMMKLRKELTMARLAEVRMSQTDRVVRFIFETEAGRMSLLFEATGHHPNVFLLDEKNVILGSLGPNLSRKRELVIGERYQWPLPAGKSVAQSFRFLDDSRPVWQQVKEFYEELMEKEALEQEISGIRHGLKRAIRHEARKLTRIRKDLDKANGADELYRQAQLLKANLGNLGPKPRPHFVELTDESGEKVRINLDPRMTPAQNMQWMFKRVKALRRGRDVIETRLRDSQARLEGLEELYRKLSEKGYNVEEIREKAREFGVFVEKHADKPVKKEASPQHSPFRVFRSVHNERILVGKTGVDNEYLTFRVARDNDYWFHVTGVPGPHVILVRQDRRDVDFESIRDAAMLAAHFSKRDEKTEVMYTQRKHVRRVKGGKAGSVRVRLAKNILIVPDEKRLQRLLDSEER